ncbi:MAG: uncharacterized protein QOG48_2188 [Verrucomicrobiota bacterium]|jgi:membrane-anchored protein YejM (alkaline phosphatase superfamily)
MRGETPKAQSSRTLSLAYFAFVVALSGVLAFALGKVQPGRGGFAYPEGFYLFRILFYIQFGLFGGALCSVLLYATPRLPVHFFGRTLIWVLFYLWFVWQVVWSLVQRWFGIELTPQMALELFVHPTSIDAVGLSRWEFASVVGISFAIIGLLAAASLSLSRRCGNQLRLRVCFAIGGLFLLLHIPVRVYFVHHINRNDAFILAFDDCAPFPLRSERLIPGLRSARMALPNFESETRTARYFDYVSNLSMPPIPRPRSILWINIESLRFDAIDEQVMPHLWAYRDQFQIQLNQQHWSSGNCTQFGVFSMLTGLSGYHFNTMRRSAMKDPFLNLLAKNNYRLRVAKEAYVRYGGFEVLFPVSTVSSDFDTKLLDEGDRRMVENYLTDRRERDDARLAFDFLPIDAPHWPYRFPADHAVFLPIPDRETSIHLRRSVVDLEKMRNAYRNCCHFADEQIGKVLDDLQVRGHFADTIVIVVGDHGEEFQERGQTAHSAVLNDFQARTVLWMHLPDVDLTPFQIDVPTTHMDIVPTLLQALGFHDDILYTQGRSLLSKLERRPVLSLCEQGFSVPLYRALVTDTYISRWWRTRRQYLFSGVQRRDGMPVQGDEWANEARKLYPAAAGMFEIVPDIFQPPRKFDR